MLVAAHSRETVPVSCVERGRWDGQRAGESVTPAPQAVHPDLRMTKRARMNAAVAAGGPARANQSEVWSSVAGRMADEGVDCATAAMHDLYDAKRAELRALGSDMEPVLGRLGALALVGGRPIALDAVSRPDVFVDLLPRLV